MIQQLLLLNLYDFSSLKHFFKGNVARVIIALSFVFVALLTFVGVFYIAHTFFYYFSIQERVLKEVLFLETLSTFSFFLFLMVMFGAIVFSFSLYFHNKKLEFLITFPIQRATLFLNSFVKVFLLSLVGLFLIAFPVMASYGVVWRLGLNYYCSLVALIFLLALLSSSLGVVLLCVAVLITPRRKSTLAVLLALLVSVGAALLIAKFVSPSSQYIESLADKEIFSLVMARRYSLLLPSTWFAEILFSFAFPQYSSMQGEFVLLSLSTLVSVGLVSLMAKSVFFALWEKCLEQQAYYLPSDPKQCFHYVSRSTFPFAWPKAIFVLIAKDALVLVRNIVGFSKSLFLLLLFLLYFFILLFADKQNLDDQWRALMLGFVFGAFGYLTVTLALYFVFPAISSEGGSLWLLRSAPVSPKAIYWGKLLLWVVFAFPFSFIMLYFVLYTFALPCNLFVSLLVLGIVQTEVILIGCYTVGAAYPVFGSEKDIEMMSTSMQGIVITLLCFFYVATLSWVVHLIAQSFFSDRVSLSFVVFISILFSLLVIFSSLRWSFRKYLEIVI
ncbi:MAG: hypothetical protein WCP97_02665 [bacterium]